MFVIKKFYHPKFESALKSNSRFFFEQIKIKIQNSRDTHYSFNNKTLEGDLRKIQILKPGLLFFGRNFDE